MSGRGRRVRLFRCPVCPARPCLAPFLGVEFVELSSRSAAARRRFDAAIAALPASVRGPVLRPPCSLQRAPAIHHWPHALCTVAASGSAPQPLALRPLLGHDKPRPQLELCDRTPKRSRHVSREEPGVHCSTVAFNRIQAALRRFDAAIAARLALVRGPVLRPPWSRQRPPCSGRPVIRLHTARIAHSPPSRRRAPHRGRSERRPLCAFARS